MLLWVIIIISLSVAWVGLKKGFFVMFTTLFNLMFAIFISVLSTQRLMHFSSGYETSGYYAAAMVFLLFILVFGVLQVFACFCILQDRDEYFPRILDKVGSAIIGFLCGYIICCLLVLIFCAMPCSTCEQVNWLSTRDNMEKLSVPGVQKVCNFLGWYSLHCFDGNSEGQIHHLLTLANANEETEEEIKLSPEGIEDIIDDSKEGATLKEYAPGG